MADAAHPHRRGRTAGYCRDDNLDGGSGTNSLYGDAGEDALTDVVGNGYLNGGGSNDALMAAMATTTSTAATTTTTCMPEAATAAEMSRA